MNKKNKPDFLIVGASKTATEWLRMCLRDHPQVYIPDGLTIDYFSKNYEKGRDWYLSHFEDAKRDDIILEKSTSYIVYENVPKRIRNLSDSIEIIFILRNPLERAYSHYCMHLKAGKVSENVDEEISLDSRYVKEGLYYQNIKRFEKFIDRDNIHVLFYDNLLESPRKFWLNFLHVIGVDNNVVPENVHKKHHTRKGLPKFPFLYRLLVRINRFMRQISNTYNDIFLEMKKRGVHESIYKIIGINPFPSLSRGKTKRLKEIFQDDYTKLKKHLNGDTPEWFGG